MAEWPNASVSKTDSRATVTGVRIPPLPNLLKNEPEMKTLGFDSSDSENGESKGFPIGVLSIPPLPNENDN